MKSTKVQTLGADHAIDETLVNGQDSNNAQWDRKKGGKKSNALPGFKPGTTGLTRKKKEKKSTTGTRTPGTSDLGIWTTVL